jgi:hypothetical protein
MRGRKYVDQLGYTLHNYVLVQVSVLSRGNELQTSVPRPFRSKVIVYHSERSFLNSNKIPKSPPEWQKRDHREEPQKRHQYCPLLIYSIFKIGRRKTKERE